MLHCAHRGDQLVAPGYMQSLPLSSLPHNGLLKTMAVGIGGGDGRCHVVL